MEKKKVSASMGPPLPYNEDGKKIARFPTGRGIGNGRQRATVKRPAQGGKFSFRKNTWTVAGGEQGSATNKKDWGEKAETKKQNSNDSLSSERKKNRGGSKQDWLGLLEGEIGRPRSLGGGWGDSFFYDRCKGWGDTGVFRVGATAENPQGVSKEKVAQRRSWKGGHNQTIFGNRNA